MNYKETKFYELITKQPDKAKLIHKVFKKEIKRFAKRHGWMVNYDVWHRCKHSCLTRMTKTKIKIWSVNGNLMEGAVPKTHLTGVAQCHPEDEFNGLI